MTMSQCRECKGQVSSGAKVCPHCGARDPAMSHGAKLGSIVIGLLLFALAWWWLSSDEPTEPEAELTFSQTYPGPWREDMHANISRTLASKSIRGCGQYKYRESVKSSNEFLVYCTREGTNWVSYLVWPSANAVMGPYKADPTVAP